MKKSNLTSCFLKVFMASTTPVKLERASNISPAWLLPIFFIILNSYFGFFAFIYQTILKVSFISVSTLFLSLSLRKYLCVSIFLLIALEPNFFFMSSKIYRFCLAEDKFDSGYFCLSLWLGSTAGDFYWGVLDFSGICSLSLLGVIFLGEFTGLFNRMPTINGWLTSLVLWNP